MVVLRASRGRAQLYFESKICKIRQNAKLCHVSYQHVMVFGFYSSVIAVVVVVVVYLGC